MFAVGEFWKDDLGSIDSVSPSSPRGPGTKQLMTDGRESTSTASAANSPSSSASSGPSHQRLCAGLDDFPHSAPLHYNFKEAADGGADYDMRSVSSP